MTLENQALQEEITDLKIRVDKLEKIIKEIIPQIRTHNLTYDQKLIDDIRLHVTRY